MLRASANLGFALILLSGAMGNAVSAAAIAERLSPCAVIADAQGARLYLACATANQVAVYDTGAGRIVGSIPLPSQPSGLALAKDGRTLWATCAAPDSQLCAVDLAAGALRTNWPAGHTALSPVLASDGARVYVCRRFDNRVSGYDTRTGREVLGVPVAREPIALALTPDGRFLLIAHHLPSGSARALAVAAPVSVVSAESGAVVKEIRLPSGSTLLREIRISPDGQYACVTHGLGRYHMPTTQLNRGWMNTSALSVIALGHLRYVNTVLLDDPDRGAANPWALAWTADGRTLCVTHAGTHEVSLIDFPALMVKLPVQPPAGAPPGAATEADAPNNLAFLAGMRQRVKLGGNGPRAIALVGARAYVAGYFSDTLETLDLSAPPAAAPASGTPAPALATLRAAPASDTTREGERWFNDASICFQGWQSCASCHSDDARVDGLNWDLLNDGLGNPKNTKSLVLAHLTPPAMSTGVRDTAQTAVRSGFRHILFARPNETVARAVDDWLKSLEPLPSPHRADGAFSPAARRGQALFDDAEVGCAACHPPGLFTDLKPYDVGTRGPLDRGDEAFDTPTLREVWRTAPYLHDGSAATLREVLTTRNPGDGHGRTSGLTASEIDDLVEYVSSL